MPLKPQANPTASGSLGLVLLVILSIFWGLAFVAIRRADMELSPVNLTLLRWLIASGGFLALAPFISKAKTRFKREHIPRVLLLSLLSVAGYHLSLNYAEKIVSAGLAGLLISIEPIFVVLLSVFFLKERMGRKSLIALGMATVGAIILSIGADLSFQQITGPLAVVFSAFAFAAFAVSSKPLVRDYGPLPVAVWAAVIGTAFLLPFASWSFVAEISRLSLTGWLSVLYLAILSTVIANMILYNLIGTKAISRLSIQLYLVPVVSIIGGILLLGEGITFLTIVGAALLLSATGLVTGKH